MDLESNMPLAEKLVALRKGKGHTQAELAELLQVSRQAISRWEVGTAVPSTDNLRVLANLYSVSVDYLLNQQPTEIRQSEPLAPQASPQAKRRRLGRSEIALIGAAILFLASIAFFLMAQYEQTAPPKPIPMYDLPTVVSDNYPSGTFKLR